MSPRWKPKRKPLKTAIHNAVLIKLTRRLLSIIDARDAEWVCMHNWCSGKRKEDGAYAARNGVKDRGKMLTFLHSEVWQRHRGKIPPGKQIHHRNGNTLDNRLENLEAISIGLHNSLKTWNRNLPRGVVISRSKSNPFMARIGCNGRYYYLGCYHTPQLAHQAYLSKWRYLYRRELKEIGRPVLV